MSKAPSRTVVLLGPQKTNPDVGSALAELGIRGKVALVMAGYQERESDDGKIVEALGVPGGGVCQSMKCGPNALRTASRPS